MTNTIWIALEIFLTLSCGFITAYCIELFKWVLDGYEKREFSMLKFYLTSSQSGILCLHLKQDKLRALIKVIAERFSVNLQYMLNVKSPLASQSYSECSDYSAQVLPGIHYLGPK